MKKGFLFNFVSDFPILFAKSRCSLRKKDLHFNFMSDSAILFLKSGCSPKKKRSSRQNRETEKSILREDFFFLENTLILGTKQENH